MNTSKKLIFSLVAGIAFSAAAPAFADSYRGRGYDHRDYNRHEFREHDRYGYRHEFREYDRYGYRHHYDNRRVVVIERPYVVQRSYVMQPPVIYSSAPMPAYGPAQMIGSALGSFIDNQY